MPLKTQLQESWKHLTKLIRNSNTFDIGLLNHICNILLFDDLSMMEQQLQMSDNNISKTYNNSNGNNGTTTAAATDFVASVVEFLQAVIDKPQRKGGQQKEQPSSSSSSSPATCQHLSLIVLDSIVFNLYARSKKLDKLRLNNSFFNTSTSMSMSQMSDQFSEHNSSTIHPADSQLKLALTYIQALSTNANFFKKLKLIYDRQGDRKRNHHYLENLLETLEYVLTKEKLAKGKETFVRLKEGGFKGFVGGEEGQRFSVSKEVLQQVNSAIFTNQLNKLTTLLSSTSSSSSSTSSPPSPSALSFSLHRIYFTNLLPTHQQRRHFRHLTYTSSDMIFNLSHYYISSFTSKLQVFEQSKNVLFLWLKKYLVCFFMPVWRRWVGVVGEVGSRAKGEGGVGFYKANEELLERVMLGFVDELPGEVVGFLNLLFRVVERCFGVSSHQRGIGSSSSKGSTPIVSQQTITYRHQQSTSSSLIPVKRFFIYSFLADPQLIKQHLFSPSQPSSSSKPTHEFLQQFQQTCNYLINLFFSSSFKKYTSTHTPQQLSVLMSLSQRIERRFDERVMQYDQNEAFYEEGGEEETRLGNYFIEEPILNYDYEVVYRALVGVEFTPVDFKMFNMVKDWVGVGGGGVGVMGSREVLNGGVYNQEEESYPYQQKDKGGYHTSTNQPRHMLRKDTQSNIQTQTKGQYPSLHSHPKRELTMSPTKGFPFQQPFRDDPPTFPPLERPNLLKHKTFTATTDHFYPSTIPHLQRPLSHTIWQEEGLGGEEEEEEVDFLTWMTVGGSADYKKKVSVNRQRLARTTNRLSRGDFRFTDVMKKGDSCYQNDAMKLVNGWKNDCEDEEKELQNGVDDSKKKKGSIRKAEFKSFDREKVKEINRLYEEYACKNFFV